MAHLVYPIDGCWAMLPDKIVQHLRETFAVVEVDSTAGSAVVADMIQEAQRTKDDSSWVNLLRQIQPLAVRVRIADSVKAGEPSLEFFVVPFHNIFVERHATQDEAVTRELVERCTRALPVYVSEEV